MATPAATGSRTVLVALAIQQLLMAYDSTAMNVNLSNIVEDLDTTLTGVQSAIAVYALVMAAFMVTGSKLGTRHGHGRVFTLGAVTYGSGALLTALSPDLAVMLIAWSVLEGIGAALIFPAIFSIATLTFSGPKRVRALATIGAMAGVGAALGPILGGMIGTAFSWRVSFAMETLVTAVVIVLMRRLHEPRRPRPERRFDFIGVVLSALGFGLVVLGLLQASAYGFIEARADFELLGVTIVKEGGISPTVLFVVAGMLVLVAFAWWERARIGRGEEPLVRLAVMRNAVTRVGSLAMSMQFLVMAGVLFVAPVFLQTALAYDALESGVAVLPATIALLFGAAVASRLASTGRVGAKPLVTLGFVLMAAGCALIGVMFGAADRGADLAPGLALAGLGIGLCAVLPDVVQSSAPADGVSDVAGLSRSFSYLGQSLGVALAGGVMVAVLVASFSSLTNESSALTPPQKTTIEQRVENDIQATAVSDNHVREAAAAAGWPPQAEDELVRINGEARADGLTAAALTLAVMAAAGFLLALRLPLTAEAGVPDQVAREPAGN